MTFDEALAYSLEHKPKSIYLGGKTSTGKSTFAHRLKDSLDYHILDLDQIVFHEVVKARDLPDGGSVFVHVYKLRERLDWIHDFILAAQARIELATQQGEKLILEGAVANPETLLELLAMVPGVTFFYFHPRNLDVYERNLTNRFMLTKKNSNAGLPQQFWQLVNNRDFEQFCTDHVLTDGLKQNIHQYALVSQQDSEKRLSEQSKTISGIILINI